MGCVRSGIEDSVGSCGEGNEGRERNKRDGNRKRGSEIGFGDEMIVYVEKGIELGEKVVEVIKNLRKV